MSSSFVRPRIDHNVAIAASGEAIRTMHARDWAHALSGREVLPLWTQPSHYSSHGIQFAQELADGGPAASPLFPEGLHKAPLAEFFEARMRTLRKASALLIVNYGEANMHAKNNRVANPVNHYLMGEASNTMHVALGMGRQIFLTEGYPENHPNPMMQPDVLESLGIVALDPQMSIEERADIVVSALERPPQPDPTEAMK